MRKRIAIIITIILAVMLTAAACQTNTGEETPTQALTPTPEPTPIPPITRTDVPEYFMPGIAGIGIVPQGSYHIGVVLDDTYDGTARFDALSGLCDAYAQTFGVTFSIEVVSSVQAQSSAVDAMIVNGIDFLILSPQSDPESAATGDICAQNDVPYITMNRSIGCEIGQGGYVCTIQPDAYMAGVLTGLSLVQEMTGRHGYPKGNIGELTGVVNDEASVLWSMGVRRVLSEYEELNVVCSITGGNDDDTRYKAAVNLLKAFREGELHGIITFDDEAAVMTLQAIADYDRGDMTGLIWSVGGTKDGLTAVWYSDIAQTIERTQQVGMTALEYALQYLEGGGADFPDIVNPVIRVFSAQTQPQKDAIAALIADMNTMGTDVCFESIGDYALFMPDLDALNRAYPAPYYEQDAAYLSAFEPYSTADAIYDTEEEN